MSQHKVVAATLGQLATHLGTNPHFASEIGQETLRILEAIKDLPVNILGAANRYFKSDKDAKFKLGDGTPITPENIIQALAEALSITNSPNTLDLLKNMTYAPMGPEGNVCINRFNQDFPDLKDKAPTFEPRDRRNLFIQDTASAVITKKGFTTIRLEDLLSSPEKVSTTPLRLSVTPEEYAQHKAQLTQFVTDTNHVLCISLNSTLPLNVAPTSFAPLQLFAVIYGNPEVQAIAAKTMGYIGPVFSPLAQALYGCKVPAGEIRLSNTDPTSSFTADFNQKCGTQIPVLQATLVDGGCSGALFDIIHRYPTTTFIPAPCFRPIEGIVISAHGSPILVQNSYTGLIERLQNAAPEALNGKNILLNFPGNPDGDIPNTDQVKTIIEIAKQNNMRLIIDSTYFNMVTPEALRDFQSAMELITESAPKWTMIASGTKAYGLCMFRVALVVSDPETTKELHTDQHLMRATDVAAFALQQTLANPETPDFVARQVMESIHNNAQVLHHIINGTLAQAPKEPGKDQLNDDYKAFEKVVNTLREEFPGVSPILTLSERKGALYLILSAPDNDQIKVRLRELLTQEKVAVIPIYVFNGETVANLADLNTKVADGYRFAPLADSGVTLVK